MLLSKYIKIYPYSKKQGISLLFSTKKASMIVVEKTLLTSIEKGELSVSEEKTLSDLGFLVSDLAEEKEEMLSLFDKANERITRQYIIAVMNLDCNLACTYCFEGEKKGKYYMSPETTDFLIRHIDSSFLSKGRAVYIEFYGGEPLLSFENIKYISKKIIRKAEKKGVEYSFNLVTNGTLLTGERTKELAALGLKEAKITIDGLPENHNIYRPFKSGAGSFNIIVENLKQASQYIKIQLGGNFTQQNYREFPKLLDYLLKEGITQENFSIVKFDPISKTEKDFGLPDFQDGCESINEPWLFEASNFFREEILKRDFPMPKIRPSYCMIELKDNIVVNYDGTFYKCPGFIGHPELSVGNLKSGLEDYSVSHNLEIWKKEECLDCEYLPICFGGCRYMKLMRDGKIDGVDCRKAYLDAVLEDWIKQEIKYNLVL